MRWIVGVDLHERSHGAVLVAAWLARSSRAHVAIATHVLEGGSSVAANARGPLTKFETLALDELSASLAHDEVEDAFADVGLMEATSAEDGLEGALTRHRAGGLIVGRRAARYDDAWIRLGRVARRLLRTLPVPVIVVPPDLPADAVGRGPVIVTTDMTPPSDAGLALAQKWATDVDRPLIALHVVESPANGPRYLPADDWDDAGLAARVPDGRAVVERWLAKHEAYDVDVMVERGHVLSTLRSAIERVEPSLVVCGSRRLSTAERIFSSSVASALAAHATAPVAVIPPDER